jgi:uncharacterized protein YjeT (DUF2065 family)
MTDLLTALALVLVIEGSLYALFPQPLKRAAVMLVRQPESRLRVTGLVLACLGVAAVWAIRHHS